MAPETETAHMSISHWKLVPYALIAVLVGLLLLVANTGGAGEFRWRHLLTLGIVILAAAAILYALSSRGMPRLSGSFAMALGLFAALAFLSALSLIWGSSPYNGLRDILLTLTYLASFLLAYLLLREMGAVRVFMGGVTVVSVSLCAYGLVQYFFNFSELSSFLSRYGMGYELSDRVFSRFTNPNVFAGFLNIAIPLTLALVLVERRRAVKLLWGAALALQLLSLYLTQSRGGWLSLIVIAVLLVFLVPRRVWRGSWRILLVVLLLAVALSFLSALYDPLGGGENGGGESYSGADVEAAAGSLRGRLGIWRGGLEMFSDNLAGGVGAGSFGVAMQGYQYRAYYSSHAHNYLLERGAETGLLGLLIVAALSILVLLRIRRVFKPGLSGSARVYAVALWAVAVGFLLHNLFDFSWYNPLTGAVFWLCAGALYAVTESGAAGEGGKAETDSGDEVAAGEAVEAPSESAAAGRPLLLLSSIVLAALVAVTGYFMTLFFLADTYEEAGDERSYVGEVGDAVESYERSLDFREANPNAHKKLADLYRDLYAEGVGVPSTADSAALSLGHYGRAIELDPEDAYKHQEKGVLLLYLGEFEEGRRALERAHELYPNSPTPLFNRGQAYLAEGRPHEAEDAYLEALELLPFYADPSIIPFREGGGLRIVLASLAKVVEIRAGRGDFDGALEEIERAMEELPEEGYLYFLRAWVYREAGDPERALEDYKRAAELDPGKAGIHLAMGEIYVEMEEYEAARREFELELEANPQSREALEGLESLEGVD